MDTKPSSTTSKAPTIEEIVGALLIQQKKTLAIAESCTGGRISARMTRVPGSSRYFEAACVTYSNRSKELLLSVPKSLLDEKGAVSQEVGAAMAEGVRERLGTDLGLAVTGIAGPGGGSAQKPVGQVFIALSDRLRTISTPFHFQGDREAIQSEATARALEILRQYLVGDK
jgi:nicotinamide-nucleotide amidase